MLLIPEININSRTLINQNPHFYEYRKNSAVIDVEIARQRLNALNKRTGPRVVILSGFLTNLNRGDSPTI
jgi:hypothetical protein